LRAADGLDYAREVCVVEVEGRPLVQPQFFRTFMVLTVILVLGSLLMVLPILALAEKAASLS
jgi:hypothetical protein